MRLEHLRRLLDEKGLDVLLITQPENRWYLSGFSGSAGILIISRERAILATDFRYVEQAKAEASKFDIRTIEARFTEVLALVVSELGAKKVGFEAASVTYGQFKAWSEVADGWELVPTEQLVETLRAVKDAQELSRIEQAVQIGDGALEYILGIIRPGLTEREVAWELEVYMRTHGAQNVAFEIIVASGPNSALPHARPTERRLLPGEPIILDLGASSGHYCGDLTRTVCLEKPDGTFRTVYDTVLRAQTSALEGIRIGMSGREADELARKVIEEAGYGEAFGHAVGHGVGLAIHERPWMGKTSEEVLQKGMVLTVEPGIYLPGWGGVRIEDLVTLEGAGVKVLSHAPKLPAW